MKSNENTSAKDAPLVYLASESPERMRRYLSDALDQLCICICLIDLLPQTVLILYNSASPETAGNIYDWTVFLENYCRKHIEESYRPAVMKNFSIEELLYAYSHHRMDFTHDVHYQQQSSAPQWVSLSTRLTQINQRPSSYFYVRKADELHLQKSIIDLFVYNKSDYFIYLDAKKNSYIMFSNTNVGSPLPQKYCDDYERECDRYAQKYIVEEDREMVICETRIKRILEKLNLYGVHTLYCGVHDPVYGYTRKKMEYRYYDQETQLILLVRTDITDTYSEHMANQKVLESALLRSQTDPLTGLLNYQGSVDHICSALSKSWTKSSLFFIDLDNFKAINDTFGHSTGDELLRQIAKTLHNEIRPTDIIGRVGGDEFIVFLPNIKTLDTVKQRAQHLCDSLKNIQCAKIPSDMISCSIGIAIAPDNGNDYHSLTQKADQQVYRAKAEGKNRYALDE